MGRSISMDTSLSDMSASLSVPRQATPRVARTVGRYEDMSMADNLKLVFTYSVILIVIVGGGLMLYDLADNQTEGAKTVSLAIVGFIGLALGYVVQRETATQATRAAQSSSAQGADQGAAVPHQ